MSFLGMLVRVTRDSTEVLVEGTAPGNVDQLKTTANPQNGLAEVGSSPQEADFKSVAGGPGFADLLAGFLPVITGVDILATRDNKSIKMAHDHWSRIQIIVDGDNKRDATVLFNCSDVVFIDVATVVAGEGTSVVEDPAGNSNNWQINHSLKK